MQVHSNSATECIVCWLLLENYFAYCIALYGDSFILQDTCNNCLYCYSYCMLLLHSFNNYMTLQLINKCSLTSKQSAIKLNMLVKWPHFWQSSCSLIFNLQAKCFIVCRESIPTISLQFLICKIMQFIALTMHVASTCSSCYILMIYTDTCAANWTEECCNFALDVCVHFKRCLVFTWLIDIWSSISFYFPHSI